MAQRGMRTDIQGLRALAVGVVVVFHLSASLLPGGYIGVDVFFVISGFLITGHLLREVERTGRVRLSEFWARRVRRLLPAAFLVLLVSALAVHLLMPASLRLQNFAEIGFAAIYGLNWFLSANSVDYLGADSAPSIVQHYWSLSVEEQFYIVWPILIVLAVWAAGRSRRIDRRRAVAYALGAVLVLSLLFSVVETARSQPSAYFMTTTRAWEFALGGLVAMLPASRLRGAVNGALSWLALLIIVVSAFALTGESPFPGWIALFPVGAAAALIWLGDPGLSWTPQRLARFRPVQFVGDASYAIYLWHWPLIVVVTAKLGRAPGWYWAGAILAATLLLSVLTKHLVEDPVRRAPGALARRAPTFAFMLVGMALVGALAIAPNAVAAAQEHGYRERIAARTADVDGCFGAYAVMNGCADPYRVTEEIDFTRASSDSYRTWIDGEERCSSHEMGTGLETVCDFPGAGLGVVLMGDSHANHLMQPIAEIAEREGWDFRAVGRTGCTGFERDDVVRDPAARRSCIDWGADRTEAIVQDPSVDVVLLSSRIKPNPRYNDAAVDRLQRLVDAGKQVVVLRDVPGMPRGTAADGVEAIDGPECVEAAGVGAVDPCAWTPPTGQDWLLRAADLVGVDVVDLRELLCTEGSCHAVIGGTNVYFDDDHLSASFAGTLVPWFAQRLLPLLPARS
ncbi:acyltransferase [Leucobacter allii]|uniref:Acyltransferase n=1 Tax=Leucobacter allii TaxID=2932247 RepID=A0ABY4FN94_9MICO|nr:acyltransferase family protein [Leucobacter allii]UOQ57720.1 acyltransferase [Leucobacter allii]